MRPSSAWANWHEPGDYTAEHSHAAGARQTHVAAVYYIEKQPSVGDNSPIIYKMYGVSINW